MGCVRVETNHVLLSIVDYHRVGQVHITEHTLQLGCELASALGLQLRDHRFLRVVGDRLVQQQPLRQVDLVVALEDVLLLQELEQDHRLLQHYLCVSLVQL